MWTCTFDDQVRPQDTGGTNAHPGLGSSVGCPDARENNGTRTSEDSEEWLGRLVSILVCFSYNEDVPTP